MTPVLCGLFDLRPTPLLTHLWWRCAVSRHPCRSETYTCAGITVDVVRYTFCRRYCVQNVATALTDKRVLLLLRPLALIRSTRTPPCAKSWTRPSREPWAALPTSGLRSLLRLVICLVPGSHLFGRGCLLVCPWRVWRGCTLASLGFPFSDRLFATHDS